MKLRHVWVWGSIAILLLLLLPGLAAAQDSGYQSGGLWLPYSASDYSDEVDYLYRVIFWLTTGMFVLTEGLLIAFCVLYRRRPGHKPHYTHGSNKAEITWTVVPALMLLGLAVWQIGTWNRIKKPDWKALAAEKTTTVVDVLGQQFKWNFRYPGSKDWYNQVKAKDDDAIKNEYSNLSNLHIPFGHKALLNLRSADVIHSVFIPHMRVKQDTVPGLRQRIWFKPNRIQVIDLKAPPEKASYKTLKEGEYFVQKFQWANDPKEFEKGGKFADLKIALSGYVQKENGLFDALNPAAKVRMLHQGDVKDGVPWSECNAAVGIFEIACAELCGAEHNTMRAFLTVDPTLKAYEAWLKAEAVDDVDLPIVWKAWKN